MTIRRARAEDADAVADVFVAALANMTYLPQTHTERENRAFVRDVLLTHNEVWIAEGDESLVGFVGLRENLLGHLWVHPDAQNQGVGTALLSVAKSRRPGGLQLWVFQKNTGARRFYERHGFELVCVTDGSANAEKEPDALYEWRPQRP